MNDKVKQLIDLVKEGKLEEAQQVATELEPPVHKSELVKRWLATYSLVSERLYDVNVKGIENSEAFKEVINFMKNVDGASPINTTKIVIATDALSDCSSNELLLLSIYFFEQVGDLIQQIVLPHLQVLGIYPSTQDASDN